MTCHWKGTRTACCARLSPQAAAKLTRLFSSTMLPANQVCTFTHQSLGHEGAQGFQQVIVSTALSLQLAALRASCDELTDCQELEWYPRLSPWRLKGDDLLVLLRPQGWPHGHSGAGGVLGGSYLQLITISTPSSKELPNPLNPLCWKHTFQAESIFISILLKQRWLFSCP